MTELAIVATPIGNMGDITYRAIETLKAADVIFCEDTRETRKILDRYDIAGKRLVSYHAQSGETKKEAIIEMLREGGKFCLVSDAGTPGISDPGAELVSLVRDTFSPQEISILTIPGASALTAALSIAGLPVSNFTFLGFLPHKKGRETLFKEIAGSERTVIFYESPHRIMKTLESLSLYLDPARPIAVLKELTKIHEEVVRDGAAGVLKYFTEHPDKVRGEFVVIVSPQ